MRNLLIISFILFLLLPFCSVNASISNAETIQLGKPETFAVRFDGKTGELSEIIYKNETLTVSNNKPQRFDIKQDRDWIFGKNKPEFLGFEQNGENKITAVQKSGNWTAVFHYEINPATATLKRTFELEYTGKEPAKIKSFWSAYPTFKFGKDAGFFIPAQYPPKKYNPENFAEGQRTGSWKNSAPLVFQLDKNKSIILLSDNLKEYSDRPSSGIERRDGGVRLTQSYDIQGHVKTGTKFKFGDTYIRFVSGNDEAALLQLHPLMKELGHTVPKDRPKWFEEAILYSFHPGGTIGSGCKDLGGFKPATEQLLDRIKETGCNSIWLMPLEDKSIYWPRDYYKFQEGLGSTPEKAGEEYKALVVQAHNLGLHVLQDSVPHGGGNPNERSTAHPEWLVQDEDGKTFNYWGFDFNSPTWIDYMEKVAAHYVKEYGIDGYRVDACGGSKTPNWNPEIPYARASYSQSQGGLNMLRAIRKAVKENQPDGGTLAEVNTGIWGAVSDATYDFDLCYNVFHDVRKLPADEFVKRLRRWLHEQQYSEIPDMLRLRHVESHDSLRAQLWYGTETHRALVAVTAFIHGMPLIYHEQETGHIFDFKQIFDIRKALPELNGGDADYLSVDAPPGVFACLRTKGDDASIIAVDFNDKPLDSFTISVPWNKLPEGLQKENRFEYFDVYNFDLPAEPVKKTGHCFQLRITKIIPHPFDPAVLVLRKQADAVKKEIQQKSDGECPLPKLSGKYAEADSVFERTNDGQYKMTVFHHTAYIDSETGLINKLEFCGKQCLGKAELVLPADIKDKAGKAEFTQDGNKSLTVKRSFGDAQLEMIYSWIGDSIRLESRWSNNVPRNAALSLPLTNAVWWQFGSFDGVFTDRYRPRHLTTDSITGPIYWRQQGTNVVFDSLLFPVELTVFPITIPGGKFILKDTLFNLGYNKEVPVRVRLLDRTGSKKELSILLSWTDENVPQVQMKPEFSVELGMLARPSAVNSNFRPAAGGYIFENEHYKLRLTRSGTIMSLEKKDGTQIIHEGNIYTDYGHGGGKIRYGAENDVEAGCRIVQDGDTLRLRFEGQLRGFGRFDLMRPPVEYFTEYALKKDSPAFGFSCGVKTAREPQDKKAFLALFVPMLDVKSFAYFDKDGKIIAEGTNENAKERSYQTGNKLPERIVLKGGTAPLLELTDIRGEASNIFLDRQNFFAAFDDGQNIGKTQEWRTFSVVVQCSGSFHK